MARAKKFYEDLFGYSFEDHDMGDWQMAWFPMEADAPQSAGTLMKGDGYVPSSDGVRIYFSVDSVEETLKKVENFGGKLMTPKRDIGEHGFIAWIGDSEGNTIAIHSMEG